ncbi:MULTISPECIES: RNA polymerase sigma factor [unclassified Lactococcus]|uniref:RNA polymerase sigma factor n=1 Tax=unclassified Lactococcus TaxID=2643510 RepID=UPI0011C8E50A|nr:MULTISPECIES: RNA polymerase sigma factor [unclassified Lactococcus]MQW23987.1 sigma-70 family RNA polymerase sigma factor [Lactococcus sp. dk101]TXK36929.1 RNA polymerase sigma factor [Lactococcus sp. dk310]TXK47088.1 RNA polymerase sigma factor [Lactococcus sp. dk322]
MDIREYENQIEEHCSEITKYLISRGSSLQDAQDSVQDTIVKILELDIFIEPSKLRAWMYRVSIRNYINKFQREKRYQKIISELGRELKKLDAGDKENIDIKKFLQKLKPYEERIIFSYYFKKQSVKSIAENEAKSISKIKIDLYRARRKLKESIEKEEIKLWN